MNILLKSFLAVAVIAPLGMMVDVSSIGGNTAYAQAQQKKKRVRVVPIRQKHVKTFEKINEAFDVEDIAEAKRLLAKIGAETDLNNNEKAYVANFRGNIFFNEDNLNGALGEFKKIMGYEEGISPSFYNQMIYMIAQVYFSNENYREALNYAQRWLKTQEEPSADGYMLIGQAQYMLKNYDAALPNVQKGIQKYIEVGSVPKEGWLNLLSSIYRQKSNYNAMLPVLKQLVLHYPKKTYLLTMGGVYNELNQPDRMSAMYLAMYDQNLLTAESELVTLASLQMSQDNPYKAAEVMEKGLNDGVLKKTLQNYQIYSQALYIAKEYERSITPLNQAARLSKDGKLANQLGQSLIALGRWSEADTALGLALKKGKLGNTGQVWISRGLVRYEQKKYESAKAAFRSAQKYEKAAKGASSWIKYVDAEVFRISELKKEIVINTEVDV